jgi:hypothetical protein
MLIGTDVNDMDSTKNFTVGSIINLASSSSLLVPYTGANANVDLGTYSIESSSFIVGGGLSTQFLKADGTLDSTTYLSTITAGATYVPYSGATQDVDLGSNNLTADVLFTTDRVQTSLIVPETGAGGVIDIGLKVAPYITVDTANQRVDLNKPLYVDSSTGTAGQVLTSQGSGSEPTWTTPPVLYSATFFHNANQANGGITVANQALLNSTQQASGFTLGPDNRVNVQNTGVYFLSVNLQLVFVGGGSSPYNVTAWFTVNDVIAPNSAFTFTTSSAQNDQTLATITDTVALNAGDYIKVYWWASVAAISLLATPAGTNPTRPLSPSVNFSIFNIG